MPTPCKHRCGCGGLCDSNQPCPMAENAPPLCPQCQADYDEDPTAWEEYGCHATGDANIAALEEEMRSLLMRPTVVEAKSASDDPEEIPW